MPPPSYHHRHLLLSNVLANQPPPPVDAFAVAGEQNERGCKLDALLLAGWSASARKAVQADRDALQHAENLRLKKSDFEVLGRVGEGQFGVVDVVRAKLDGKVYAMKTVEKVMAMRAGSQLNLSLERHIHKLAGESDAAPAPQLATSFQSPTALHLVMSYASCGSLWDRLCEMLPAPGLDSGRMDETEIGWWARQMVGAISWVHGAGYAHRDIKPHNFLLLPDGRLWLTDFGSSAPLVSGKVPHRYCLMPAGTPDYVAPEVLRAAEDAVIEAAQSADDESDADRTARPDDIEPPGYGADVDYWSLGATLYEMAVGRAPFYAPTIGGTYDRIIRCDVKMPDHMSPPLKSLLSGLLSSADVRLGSTDISEIRRHSFFAGVDWTRRGSPPSGVSPQPIDLETLAQEFDHSFTDLDASITFEHFFNSTSIATTLSTSVSHSSPGPPVWGRWVGWSWDPPSDFFGDETPALSPMAPVSTPRPAFPSYLSAPAALSTPLRPGAHRTPPTVPRTAPRSVPRTRAVSERQAFAELVQCVQASAKKKMATIKMPGSASTASSIAGPVWRKEQPPTPTPMSRDVTVTNLFPSRPRDPRDPPSRPTSRASLYADLSRPESRTSMRELPPIRPASRGSIYSDLSLRPASRNSARPDDLSRRSSFSRTLSGDSLPRPASRASTLDRRPSFSRTLSGGSVPRAPSLRSRDETFLARLAAVDDNIRQGRERREEQKRERLQNSTRSMARDADRSMRRDPEATDRGVKRDTRDTTEGDPPRDRENRPPLRLAFNPEHLPSSTPRKAEYTARADAFSKTNTASTTPLTRPPILPLGVRENGNGNTDLTRRDPRGSARPSALGQHQAPIPAKDIASVAATTRHSSPVSTQRRSPPPPHEDDRPLSFYVPPTRPRGDGLGALEAWHHSLEDGLSNLEKRLRDMSARLGA